MGPRIRRTSALLIALFALGAPPALAAKTTFRPRVDGAMGIIPSRALGDIATGEPIPVVYHGGLVMSDVTVHTIFWAPSGYSFPGSPGGGALGYEPMIQQFFTDVAHDSGTTGNLFSILNQYKDGQGDGGYDISYNAAADTINDTDPYPAKRAQCPSPNGIGTCITDLELTKEVDKVIQSTDPSGYGLHDLWEVYLPPDVDECVGVGECGSNAFAGYHDLANEGHGAFVYAVLIDTLIEFQLLPGADPEGNPEAEATIDTAGHETVEAMTNPIGSGWMDPNGFEVADKCENGPEIGTPLGYAADGSPYDQVINGHEYDIQEMWSNQTDGCVQSSTVTTNGLPLPSVSLRQFSPAVSGSAGKAIAGLPVSVALVRGGSVVAVALGKTRANGSWGPIDLRSIKGALHGAGDDRDGVVVDYGRGGPSPEVIATGSGGDPFTESGWTGWFDLDTGFAVGSRSITIGPCGQTGVLALSVNHAATAAPYTECSPEADQTTISTPALSGKSVLAMSSEDNRAVTSLDPSGALVKLTIPLGEPGAVPVLGNDQLFFRPTGMPSCTADLRLQVVSCDGLVAGGRYTLTRARGHAARQAKAGGSGTARFANLPGGVPVRPGDVLRLTNSSHRTLTTLHVAHLRVAIDGDRTVLASGTCEPGDYWGPPLRSLPSSPAIGEGGAAGTGIVCPASGHAGGLPDADIEQMDDLSGGFTRTSVPELEGTVPSNDAIVSGPFTAYAQTGVGGADGAVFPAGAAVSLTVTRGSSRHRAFHSRNVAGGASVPALRPGLYTATWVVRDVNGDTRTVLTKFEERAPAPSPFTAG